MAVFVRRNDRSEVRRARRVACQVVRESDFKLIAREAIDLSSDGMFVLTSEPGIARGDKLVVSFRATGLDLWFDTEATVTRVSRGRRQRDRPPGLGLRFDTLSGVKRLILRGHLRRTPPPVPMRAQRISWADTVARLMSEAA
ncbi:MAG: PilZ domain-containing protein [Myxococcales bacterium]|nr:PilZ domain-containing protein [Myxococcales bacterium]